MQESPAFSSFRKLMDIYDETMLLEKNKKEARHNKVKSIIDGKNLIMFFKKNGSIFGAPEESRIVFARMKNPDETPDDWDDEANFNAFDLIKALSGDATENLFSMNDLPQIDVITRDEAEDSLMKCPYEPKSEPTAFLIQPNKFGANTISLKDEE